MSDGALYRLWRRLRYGDKIGVGLQGETVYGPYQSIPTGCRCNQPGDYCHCGGVAAETGSGER